MLNDLNNLNNIYVSNITINLYFIFKIDVLLLTKI